MSREITVRLADGNEVWSVDYSKLLAVSVTVENDEASVREQINTAIQELASQGAAPLDFWKNPFAIVLGGQNQSPIDAGRMLALENSFGVREDGSAYFLNIGFGVLTFSDLDRAIEAGLARGDSNEFVLIPAQRGAAGGEEIIQFFNSVGVSLFQQALGFSSVSAGWYLLRNFKQRAARKEVRKITKNFDSNGISNPWVIENLIQMIKKPTTIRISKAFQISEELTEEILYKSGRVQNLNTELWELTELSEAKLLRDKWLRSMYRTSED